jgi:transposase
VRVTTAFSRLLRLSGVWVRKVRFEPDRVIVEVALRRERLVCPECGYSTAARKDTRPENSVWRHLDLGVWRLEVHCRRRRLWCPLHGARTEGVPFARPGSEFTRDFECLVAWLAARADKTTIKRMLRIDWGTVGRIIKRVCADELDPDRLEHLYDIGIDEVSWKRQHNYLTLVADHGRGKIVWGCEGAGEKAADQFFAVLDPELLTDPRQPEPGEIQPRSRDAGEREQREQPVGERAAKLRAISLDMGHGYAKSARRHAPQAVICIDPYHVVQLANQALDEVRRGYWNELRRIGDQPAAKRFKDARWSLLKRPEKLTDTQPSRHARPDQGRRRRGMAGLRTQGSRPRHLRTRPPSRRRRGPDRPAPLPSGAQPARAIRPPRQDDPQTPRTGSSPPSDWASTRAGPRRSTIRSASSPAAPTASTPPRPRSRWYCSPAARSPFTCRTSYTHLVCV